MLARPVGRCSRPVPGEDILTLLVWLSYVAGLNVQLHLTLMRLDALEQGGPARGARGALVAAGACGTVVLLVMIFLPDGHELRAGLFLATAAAFGAFTCCVVRGLLAGAARVARSRSPLARDAARWVRLTAGTVVASALSQGLVVAVWFVGETESSLGFSAAFAADVALNCAAVLLLSGLEGPPQLRRLSQEAFQLINQYRDDQLQSFYLEYLDYLDAAQVKWVKCGYLRRLAEAGSAMVRCQEVPACEAFIGSLGFPRDRNEPKHRFVLSHPWLSREHPDPSGVKLQRLVQQLDLLGAADDDAIFIDYMGFPQNNKQHAEYQRLELEDKVPKPGEHPAVRTVAEEALFKKALGSMEMIYSVGNTPIIVLPMNDEAAAGTEYFSRGWCFFEFSLAFSFDNIANDEIRPPVKKMIERAADLKLNTVEGFEMGFKATHFTNKGDEAVVFDLFQKTLGKKVAQL